MQICETAAKFYLLTVYRNGTVCSFSGCLHCYRYILKVNTQEPANPRSFQLKISCCFITLNEINTILLYISKDPGKHIKEMYSDVSGYPSGFFFFSFPGIVVPVTSAGDIAQVDIVYLVRRPVLYPLFQIHDSLMVPELQNVPNFPAGLLFVIFQSINIPGIQHQGFLANGIRPITKGEADM